MKENGKEIINMNKLILFDWGNVLLDSDSNKYNIFDARKDIALELKPQNTQKFMDMFDKDEFWTMNGNRLNSLIQKHLMESGCHCTVDDFKECYLKHYNKVPWFSDMVSLINTLASDSRFCIGVLSTLCEMDLELLKNNFSVDKLDYRFFSFNLGIQKPDARIYDMIEVITGYSKDDILFIDDRKDNIKEAKSKGWNTVLATGYDFKAVRKECYSFMGLDWDSEQLSESLIWEVMMMDY